MGIELSAAGQRMNALCGEPYMITCPWYSLQTCPWYTSYKQIKEKYWSHNMLSNIYKFITSCSTCVQCKVPCHFPAGKLMPLPTPQICTLLYITELPKSEGNNVIHVVSDKFSHLLWLIPLPAWPTTFELAEVLFSHVFRYY